MRWFHERTLDHGSAVRLPSFAKGQSTMGPHREGPLELERERRMELRLAGLAVIGGLVNLGCDLAMAPGWGPGSAVPFPTAMAAFLGDVPVARVVGATLIGTIAISSWAFAAPALVRLVQPAGAGLAEVVRVLHVWIVGGSVAFHVLYGSSLWATGADPARVEPMWFTLIALMGGLFLALFSALAVAAWRSADVPRWLPWVSPLVMMSLLPALAALVPGPIGLPLTLSASTAGAVVWLTAIWWRSGR